MAGSFHINDCVGLDISTLNEFDISECKYDIVYKVTLLPGGSSFNSINLWFPDKSDVYSFQNSLESLLISEDAPVLRIEKTNFASFYWEGLSSEVKESFGSFSDWFAKMISSESNKETKDD